MTRINYYQTSPELFNHLLAVNKGLEASVLDPTLLALVELRVSQINGCVYCVDTHTREARKLGVNQQKLDLLPVWIEAPLFSPAERAAFGWAESLTHVSSTHAPDAEYAALLEHFSEKEIVDLSVAIALINAWNRIAVGFRKLPAAT
jgi:AhpD family alkylhydroperoxidase